MVVHKLQNVLIGVGYIGHIAFGQEVDGTGYPSDKFPVRHPQLEQVAYFLSKLGHHTGLLEHGPNILVGLVGVDHAEKE